MTTEVQELRTAFLHYLAHQKRYSNHTRTAYEADLTSFFGFMDEIYPDIPLVDIQALHIRSWLAHLRQQQIKPRSVNRKLSTLRTFFKYLQKKEHLPQNPCQVITSLKTPKRLANHLLPHEMKLLLEHLVAHDFPSFRDRLIIVLLYVTGIRRSELINLQLADFDFSRGILKVLGKGSKERQVPLTPALVKEVEAYLQVRDEEFGQVVDQQLLVTDKGKVMYPKFVYNRVHKLLAQVTTLQKKSPHILRHTFATHLSTGGADINAIKQLLGHANLGATQIYTSVDADRLQAIYDQAHPRSQEG